MGHPTQTPSIVVMGVSGSGKSVIGQLLARRTGLVFCEGDRLHPPGNIAKMSAGEALDDDERLPWLRAVGQQMRAEEERQHGSVVACSALKRSYRDILREYAPEVIFVLLDGTFEVVQARTLARNHEFMPASLLASQFRSLEPLEADERGFVVDIAIEPEGILNKIEAELARLVAVPTDATEGRG